MNKITLNAEQLEFILQGMLTPTPSIGSREDEEPALLQIYNLLHSREEDGYLSTEEAQIFVQLKPLVYYLQYITKLEEVSKRSRGITSLLSEIKYLEGLEGGDKTPELEEHISNLRHIANELIFEAMGPVPEYIQGNAQEVYDKVIPQFIGDQLSKPKEKPAGL